VYVRFSQVRRSDRNCSFLCVLASLGVFARADLKSLVFERVSRKDLEHSFQGEAARVRIAFTFATDRYQLHITAQAPDLNALIDGLQQKYSRMQGSRRILFKSIRR
jgi:hypothetical protein